MDRKVLLFRFLVELMLIGSFATAYDNIAFNKTAWQQYPYPFFIFQWGADKAVDGQFTNRAGSGGQCTISDNEKYNASWWVDLGGVLSIHHINIFYRTDNFEWGPRNGYTSRFLGFSIYISNTTDKDEGILCFKDTNYTRATIPDNVTIECVTHGRYIIYYNERLPGVTNPDGYSKYAHNELCEVEVFGCPTTGVYGVNCTLPCPQNCQEKHCNIVNGKCFGCVEGYRGSRCEKKCDNNRYGLECNMTCGNCTKGEQCDHVNGSCPNKYDAGARGEKGDKVINVSLNPDQSSPCCSFLYGVLAILCLSLTLNIFLIFRSYKNKRKKRKNYKEKIQKIILKKKHSTQRSMIKWKTTQDTRNWDN